MSNKKLDVFTMKLDDLDRRVAEATELLDRVEALLPGLVELDVRARKYSIGKLADGEDDALLTIFDAAEAHPDYFRALAAADEGQRDRLFETVHARAALARRSMLHGLSTRLGALHKKTTDTELELGAKARVIGLAAYVVGRLNVTASDELKSALGKALSFFGGPRAKPSHRGSK